MKFLCPSPSLVVAAVYLICHSSLAAALASKDGYINIDDQNKTLALGTGAVEEKIEFSNGHYLLRSFRNLRTGEQYLSPGTISSEIRLTVNGAVVDGNSGDWRWISANARVLGQGEIEATIKLERNGLQVEKHYCVYPGTSIIRQWIVLKNQAKTPIEISDPYFLNDRLVAPSNASQTLYYITGGGSFSGSQVLHQAPLTPGYARTFDTANDKPELQRVEGFEGGAAWPLPYGSGRYMPWFGIGNGESKGGVFVGLDYYGRWAAEIGNFQNSAGYLGLRLGGYTKSLKPGESIETPKALTGVWSGDLDEMGNELKNWQYAYLWDYTNNDYFGKIRFAAEMRTLQGVGVDYGGGTQDNWDYRMAALFHAAEVIRYVGADILWQDAGWHDYLGDNDGPDFRKIQQYIGKSGVRLAVWWPLWYVADQSKIHQQHPDWGKGGLFQAPLDASRPDVMQWMTNQLDRKVAKWGDFQWRQDGTAVNVVGVVPWRDKTPIVDSRLLDQYHNVMKMQREFLERHPKSSVDVCSGGGNLMSFESLRLSDVNQLTDGGSMVYGNYYSSYLFPPDKIDEWTRTQNATPVNIATTLTMAPAWMGDRGLNGHEPGISLNGGEEKLRKEFEIYHYLFREGVAGRWVQIYHPTVEGDNPIYYLERLSRDRHRGVILLKHFAEGEVHIYPKGLNPSEMYEVGFEISKARSKRSGEDLARKGITLFNPQPLELVYIGLPNHPGSGTDTIAPSEPGQVTKRVGTNVGVAGVELQWSPATDNNWLSYYQIYRDGQPIDRVSTGSFYFDHGLDANVGALYQVQAVDGDGNHSAKMEARMSAGTEAYTAWGGYLAGNDYSYQGANNWSYERWKGAERHHVIWNGGLGQQGLYQGPAQEQPLLIGATWMRPSQEEDAVRVFTLPRSGPVRITGTVHKDIYHLKGDGVRVKIMKGSQQIWPKQGWAAISAADIKGTDIDVPLQVNAGDRLFFIVNHHGDSTDDDTVWDPHVTYTTLASAAAPRQRAVLDEVDHDIQYLGPGWQTEGTPIWANHFLGDDIGFLDGRYKGTLSVSATPGDKMQLTFRGSGIYLIGETGSDRGMAEIRIDGQSKGSIDTFVPESYSVLPSKDTGPAVHLAHDVPLNPPTVLWGIDGLPDGQHILELTVLKEKNAKSTGNFIAIDQVVIDGAAVSQP